MRKIDQLKKLKSQNIQNIGYEAKIAHNKKIKVLENKIKQNKEDINMIKDHDTWPCSFALPVKKFCLNKYIFGCIIPDNKLEIIETNLSDFNPFASVIKYESIEQIIEDGWMVD